MNAQPLKVTFELASPYVSPGHPIHLDALVAYAITKRRQGLLGAEATIEDLRALSADLPFARHEQDGHWVWKASALVPEGQIHHSSTFFTQRWSERAFALRVGSGDVVQGRYWPGKPLKPYELQIDTARGVERKILSFYPLTDARSVAAWCVGDADWLEEILKDSGMLTHVGARRRQGRGQIRDIRIERDDSAEKRWQDRVRPWQIDSRDAPLIAAWNAPYWDASNRGMAYCPDVLLA